MVPAYGLGPKWMVGEMQARWWRGLSLRSVAREAGRRAKSVADRLGCVARFWNVRRLSTQAGRVANSGNQWQPMAARIPTRSGETTGLQRHGGAALSQGPLRELLGWVRKRLRRLDRKFQETFFFLFFFFLWRDRKRSDSAHHRSEVWRQTSRNVS